MDVMVNEVPRQDFVIAIAPRHEGVGIGKAAGAIFGGDTPQLMPDFAGALASRSVQAFEDRADPAIAA